MTQPKGFRTANRRYLRVYMPMILGYVFVFLSASNLIETQTAPIWLRVLAAMVVTAPLIVALWSVHRHARETDEYTRMRQLKALSQGGLITVGATLLLGFLQFFDVVPIVPVYLFGPFFGLAYGFCYCASEFGKTV